MGQLDINVNFFFFSKLLYILVDKYGTHLSPLHGLGPGAAARLFHRFLRRRSPGQRLPLLPPAPHHLLALRHAGQHGRAEDHGVRRRDVRDRNLIA